MILIKYLSGKLIALRSMYNNKFLKTSIINPALQASVVFQFEKKTTFLIHIKI